MRKRPKSVTVLAWFTIMSVGFSLLAMTFLIDKVMLSDTMAKSAIPIPVQYGIIYIGGLLTIVAGVGILTQHNWARYLYVISAGAGIVLGSLLLKQY